MTASMQPGTQFGDWTVVSVEQRGVCGRKAYSCRCWCGEVRLVQASHLRSGASKRCRGCASRISNHNRMKMNNRVEVRGDIAVIFINHKERELECLIDAVDVPRVSYTSWSAAWNKCTQSFYARGSGPLAIKNKIWMHRLLMGCPAGLMVDHENHNTLDNRRSINLRIADRSLNGLNRKGPQRDGTSGFRGVYWIAKIRKWRAAVKSHDKVRYFGSFESKEDAALAAKRGLEEILRDRSMIGPCLDDAIVRPAKNDSGECVAPDSSSRENAPGVDAGSSPADSTNALEEGR